MRIIVLVLIGISLVGCSFMYVSKRELRDAEQVWNATGIENYSYTIIVGQLAETVDCASKDRWGIEVVVVNQQTMRFGTCALDSEFAKEFGSMNLIFGTVVEIKTEGVPGLEVHFHEELGYPEYIDINYSRWFTDFRVQYHIVDFEINEGDG